MRLRSAFLAAFSLAALAQTRLEVPRLGFLVDAQGRLRPLTGAAGNFLLGDPLIENVLSATASERFVLAKQFRDVLLLSGDGVLLRRFPAPEGPALFAFTEAGDPALAYFPAAGVLHGFTAEALEPVAALDSAVLALAAEAPRRAVLIEHRESGLWRRTLNLETKQIEHEMFFVPARPDALAFGHDFLLAAQDDQLLLWNPDGILERMALPEPVRDLRPLGRDWFELIGAQSARRFALRLPLSPANLFRLPEARP